MKTELRRAAVPQEIRSLMLFDRKAFHQYPADWFTREDWSFYESWWLLIGNRKAGCCAFHAGVDFQSDIDERDDETASPGSLYIVTTGILPSFQGQGFGTLLKSWQLSYARIHGYHRIATNTRQSNARMIALNEKFGFRIVRTTPDYYSDPPESTVVMERLL